MAVSKSTYVDDTFVPNAAIALMQTIMIKASMTAYSAAVAPASSIQNVRANLNNEFMMTNLRVVRLA